MWPLGPFTRCRAAVPAPRTVVDADIKIGVDGNTEIVSNVAVSKPLSFKIPKAQAAEGEKFFKLVKAALDA